MVGRRCSDASDAQELYARQHSDMDPTSLRLILEGNRVDLTPDSVIADSLDEDTVEGEVITVDVVLERECATPSHGSPIRGWRLISPRGASHVFRLSSIVVAAAGRRSP